MAQEPPHGLSVRRLGPDGETVWVPEEDLPPDERRALWAGLLAEVRAKHLPALLELVAAPEPEGDDEDARVRRAIRSAALLCEDDAVRGELGCALDEWAFRSRGTSVGMLFVERGGAMVPLEVEGAGTDDADAFERQLGLAMGLAEGRGYAFMSMMLDKALDTYREAKDCGEVMHPGP